MSNFFLPTATPRKGSFGSIVGKTNAAVVEEAGELCPAVERAFAVSLFERE
jgi:hypothetical protein